MHEPSDAAVKFEEGPAFNPVATSIYRAYVGLQAVDPKLNVFAGQIVQVPLEKPYPGEL